MVRKRQKKLYPAQRRDRSGLYALQAVNMDGHKLDVFVQVPWSEKPVRLYLIAIQDLYSGKILSWRLSDVESWKIVRLAIGDMVETYGITALLADMSHETVELVDRIDAVDIITILKVFFAFFTKRQSLTLDNLQQN